MKRLTIAEHEVISRAALGATVCRELQALDEKWALTAGETIFDWGRLHVIKAKGWVGVVETPGVSIEIVPKIDDLSLPDARRNLLYMLAVAGNLPVRERDIASLAVERMTLLDALVLLFSERLLAELRLGLEHAYVTREANVTFVRGKLLLREHVVRNIGHDERVFVAFDEFVSDTPLNRILKRGCRVLSARTRSHAAEHNLRTAIAAFDEVSDVEIARHHFERLQLSRTSRRFDPLVEFCRIALLEGAPSLRAGPRSSFTLLFPMEKVFERFIARSMLRHAATLDIEARNIAIQAQGLHHWLVVDPSGKGRFRLDPDIVIRGATRPRLLVDTKWKRLHAAERDRKRGVSQDDIYQIVAYATRYDCDDSVLVYPRVGGVGRCSYVLPVSPRQRSIRIEFVDLSGDLMKEPQRLLSDLRRIVRQ